MQVIRLPPSTYQALEAAIVNRAHLLTWRHTSSLAAYWRDVACIFSDGWEPAVPEVNGAITAQVRTLQSRSAACAARTHLHAPPVTGLKCTIQIALTFVTRSCTGASRPYDGVPN
jgi:hypothetical protein